MKLLMRAWQRHRQLHLRVERDIVEQRLFSYVRVGFDQRIIELLPDHTIGRGADEHEQFWRLHVQKGCLQLQITGSEGITCVLQPGLHDQWRGTWLRHEKMPVLLKTVSIDSKVADIYQTDFASANFPAKDENRVEYRVLERYRRTVASKPRDKALIAVASGNDAPLPFGRAAGMLSDEVLFFALLNPATGRYYWAKKYSPIHDKQLPLELELYAELARITDKAVLPVDYQSRFGLIFEFDQELFIGCAVHAEDLKEHFTDRQVFEITSFARTSVCHRTLGRACIGELSDFQTISTSKGLTFIDFMLKPQYWWML